MMINSKSGGLIFILNHYYCLKAALWKRLEKYTYVAQRKGHLRNSVNQTQDKNMIMVVQTFLAFLAAYMQVNKVYRYTIHYIHIYIKHFHTTTSRNLGCLNSAI
jgi:hypothetical protein